MKPWYLPVRLHGLVTLNIIIVNLNILHILCIASLFITNQLQIFRNKYVLLFSIIFGTDKKCHRKCNVKY